jgi:hypothetical protein
VSIAQDGPDAFASRLRAKHTGIVAQVRSPFVHVVARVIRFRRGLVVYHRGTRIGGTRLGTEGDREA